MLESSTVHAFTAQIVLILLHFSILWCCNFFCIFQANLISQVIKKVIIKNNENNGRMVMAQFIVVDVPIKQLGLTLIQFGHFDEGIWTRFAARQSVFQIVYCFLFSSRIHNCLNQFIVSLLRENTLLRALFYVPLIMRVTDVLN